MLTLNNDKKSSFLKINEINMKNITDLYKNLYQLTSRLVYLDGPQKGPKEQGAKAAKEKAKAAAAADKSKKEEVKEVKEVKDKYKDDSFLKEGGKKELSKIIKEFDAYSAGLVPNKGKPYKEGKKMVYWNLANKGDTPKKVMSEYKSGTKTTQEKPLDAKYIDTPEGKKVIVKWAKNEKKEK